MKIELFVLPSVMREDFTDAFVLSKEDLEVARPEWREKLEAMGADFDAWYAEAYLWEKLSPDLPVADFDTALSLLRGQEGTVLFMSEAESSGKPCALLHYGREVCDFVAMAAPRELALPEDLYVFDTTLGRVIVFTHETVTTPESRFCRGFGG